MEMKLRTIKINLTDDDVRRLSKKAAVCGLTASEILENFISDLTWGDNAHGVNEKFYAGSWFVAWRSSTQPEMSFLRYLTEHGQLESILKSMSSEAPEQGEAHLQAFWKSYLQEYPKEEDAFENEVKRVRDWCLENKDLMS